MDYGAYLEELKRNAAGAQVEEYGAVEEGARRYPLLRLTVPGDRWLVLTAGFHGEEPAGPLTLAAHFAEVAALARAQGVGLRVYPCINPSGFEDGTRYNRSGEMPNNDLIRYRTASGALQGELHEGDAFVDWQPFDGGPKETIALRADLSRYPAPAAALDLHQDNFFGSEATYAYVFGPREVYLPMVREAARHAKVAVRCAVDETHHTDGCGLVYFHDGSVTDYFFRRGVPFTAALETTTQTPLERCHQVNLAWIRGFIGLAALQRLAR